MKYSTAAFTLALALLAANNDVADARVSLRGHKAGHRRLRHLKNTDSTGEDAVNRATPTVSTTVTADFIINEDVIKESKEKSDDEDAAVEEDTVTSQKSISVPDDGAETTEDESGKKKSHKAQIENMADTTATSDGEGEECKVRIFMSTSILISILPPVNVSHAEFDCIASNSIIRSFLLSPPAMHDFFPPIIHHLHQQGKKCPKTEDDAAATADEIVTVKTPKSLRGSDVATDETETQETAVAEDEEESGKGKNSKKMETEDAEEGYDAAARTDADGATTEESGKGKKKKKEETEGDATDETAVAEDEEESGKGKNSKKKGTEDAEEGDDAAAGADADGATTEESGKGKKKKEEEEEEETETRAGGDAETEMVVEKCNGKKCNKKDIAEAKADGEEIEMVVLDTLAGEEIIACKGKGCKGKIAAEVANVAEAVAEAIEGSSEVKASKMKASKISKISGDEAEVVSIPIFISGCSLVDKNLSFVSVSQHQRIIFPFLCFLHFYRPWLPTQVISPLPLRRARNLRLRRMRLRRMRLKKRAQRARAREATRARPKSWSLENPIFPSK